MIALTLKEHKITFDAVDIALCDHTWYVVHVGNGFLYARTWINYKNVYMHRLIMQAPKDMLVDHIDQNTLNNCRSNLRLATKAQNCTNSIPRFGRKYKGVYYVTRTKRYFARIVVNQVKIYLGCSIDPKVCAKMYDNAAQQYFGEFARINTYDD